MGEHGVQGVHGIILAGAYPRGSGALEGLAPRPLLPVAQQPLITYALRWMADGGLDSATVGANSAARAIRTQLSHRAVELDLDFVEDWTPRGAAGCVRDAGMKTDARSFVVADGTTVPVVNIRELLDTHAAQKSLLTVVVGADAAGRLRPSGVYVFDRRASSFIPEDGFQDIKEKLLPRLYGAGEAVATFLASGLAPRAFNAETYLALNHWALEHAPHNTSLDFRAVGQARVHGSATVAPTARLLGPILLGPRTRVGEGATLIGPVSIGGDTIVGRDAVVSRSVVWEGCVVSTGAFVDRSILADRVVVGPHQAVYSTVKVGAGDGHPPDRTPWAPIVAAFLPAAVGRP